MNAHLRRGDKILSKWQMTALVIIAHEITCKYAKASIERAIKDLQVTRRHHWCNLRITQE